MRKIAIILSILTTITSGCGTVRKTVNNNPSTYDESVITNGVKERIFIDMYMYPIFVGGDSVFQKLVSDEIPKHISKNELPIKGVTSVLFMVTGRGEVVEPTYISYDSALKSKILEILKSTSKKWMCGKLNGWPIDVTLNLNIFWYKNKIITSLFRPPDYAKNFSIELEE